MSSFVLSTFAALLSPPAGLHSSTTTRNNPLSHISCTAAANSGFDALNVRPEMIDALSSQGITKPNPLQTRAIPAINGRTDLILGAQTGSGKTLTYLVPVMAIKSTRRSAAARPGGRAPSSSCRRASSPAGARRCEIARTTSSFRRARLRRRARRPAVNARRRRRRPPRDGRFKLMELNGSTSSDVRHDPRRGRHMFDAGSALS